MKTTVIRDILIVLGLVFLVGGAWLAWPPLGWIMGGAGLVAMGLLWQLHDEAWRAEQERNRRSGL